MKEYTYGVARVRAREAALLTRQDVDQLMSAESYEAALRVVRDRGYRSSDGADVEEIASAARRELWEFVAEVADEDALRVLRLNADYHNIKASVKAVYSGMDGTDLLLEGGTADAKLIYTCVQRREYGDLNPHLAQVCEEAMALLLRTQDGQACDICVDNAMLAAIGEAARKSGSDFAVGYANLVIDTANLQAAYRCALAQRQLSFIENAVFDGGTLNVSELRAAAAAGPDAVCDYLASTRYGDCVEAVKRGGAALAKWCSDEIMRYMQLARWESFTCAPVLAYYYTKSTEIGIVRLILLGKRSRLPDDMIRERVPQTYV